MDWGLILQIVGTTLGLIYLWLEYRADIWVWLVGMIMPLVHGALYLSRGIYADAAMQLYYVAAGIYGWIMWRKRPKNTAAGRIRRTPAATALRLAGAYVVLHTAIYHLLTYCTDSRVPFWDSMSTAMCIVAMFMLSRKYVEQWLVWLAVDIISAGLYMYKGIPITAGLYILYCILAVAGYIRWRKELQD